MRPRTEIWLSYEHFSPQHGDLQDLTLVLLLE
jgi:hypothetical protein